MTSSRGPHKVAIHHVTCCYLPLAASRIGFLGGASVSTLSGAFMVDGLTVTSAADSYLK